MHTPYSTPQPDSPASEQSSPPDLNVRMSSREVDPRGWGADAPSPSLTVLHDSLREFLLANGFQIRRYVEPPHLRGAASTLVEGSEHKVAPKSRSVRPTVEAYFKGDAPFRKEAILIDDGGRTVEGRPVLSIAIRDAHGEHGELYLLVAQMLAASGISPGRARWSDTETLQKTRPDDMTTEVFRIRRLPPPGIGGQLARTLGSFLESFLPSPQPQT